MRITLELEEDWGLVRLCFKTPPRTQSLEYMAKFYPVGSLWVTTEVQYQSGRIHYAVLAYQVDETDFDLFTGLLFEPRGYLLTVLKGKPFWVDLPDLRNWTRICTSEISLSEREAYGY